MHLLALNGSPRSRGTVSTLSQQVLDGAAANGHSTDRVDLYDHTIKPCRGCWRCAGSDRCVHDDDAGVILERLKGADVVILGSPIYWSSVSAVLKNLLDRTTVIMRVFECAATVHTRPRREKRAIMLRAAREFGPTERAFWNKQFVLVCACTTPFPLSHLSREVPHTLYVLTRFVKKLHGTVIARLVATDTLFRFRPKRRERLLERAYRVGARLR